MNNLSDDSLFTETQQFNRRWFWIIAVSVNVFLFAVTFTQLVMKKPLNSKHMNSPALLLAMGFPLLLTWFFSAFKLETIIKKEGVYVRYIPFHRSYKFYAWNTLARVYTRTYSPVVEYGGWGLRLADRGKGIAYNVSGNKGLQLEFTNKKKLLIGTHKPEEITTVLRKLQIAG